MPEFDITTGGATSTYKPDSSFSLGGAASGAASGAGAGAMFGPWGALIGGVLGAGASLFGDSPQQESMEELMKKMEDAEDYIKSTPFSKDEIMNQLLPQAQKIYRGAADVLAGKAGSAVGESGVAKGQSFGEYYAQTLAPVIAGGENKAGDAISRFGEWFSNMDAQAKERFLGSVRTMMQGSQGLDNMTGLQKGVIGGLQGAGTLANIGGEMDILGELNKRLGLQDKIGKSSVAFGNTGVS